MPNMEYKILSDHLILLLVWLAPPLCGVLVYRITFKLSPLCKTMFED